MRREHVLASQIHDFLKQYSFAISLNHEHIDELIKNRELSPEKLAQLVEPVLMEEFTEEQKLLLNAIASAVASDYQCLGLEDKFDWLSDIVEAKDGQMDLFEDDPF